MDGPATATGSTIMWAARHKCAGRAQPLINATVARCMFRAAWTSRSRNLPMGVQILQHRKRQDSPFAFISSPSLVFHFLVTLGGSVTDPQSQHVFVVSLDDLSSSLWQRRVYKPPPASRSGPQSRPSDRWLGMRHRRFRQQGVGSLVSPYNASAIKSPTARSRHAFFLRNAIILHRSRSLSPKRSARRTSRCSTSVERRLSQASGSQECRLPMDMAS